MKRKTVKKRWWRFSSPEEVALQLDNENGLIITLLELI